MLLLKIYILVLTIPLASLKSSTISIRFAFLIFLFIVFIYDTNVQILGGLFQTLNIYDNILLSFTSIILKDNLLETLENSGNTNPSKLDIKTWLINNKSVKMYLDSNESKKIIYNDNNNESGIYLWLNNVNNNYYIGSAKDLKNRLARYFSSKELKIIDNLIHRAIIKHKHENFSLYIIEYCEINNLLSREQHYLDILTPPYNILKIAGSSLGYKHLDKTKSILSKLKINDPNLLDIIKNLSDINRGNIKSREFKAKRRALTLGENNPMYGKTHSIETRSIMNVSKKGISLSESHKAKIKESLAKIGPIDTKSAKKRKKVFCKINFI